MPAGSSHLRLDGPGLQQSPCCYVAAFSVLIVFYLPRFLFVCDGGLLASLSRSSKQYLLRIVSGCLSFGAHLKSPTSLLLLGSHS